MGSPCWSRFLTCGPMEKEAHIGARLLAGLVNPLCSMLEQFMKNCTQWEGQMLEKFMGNCLPWEGLHTGAEEEYEKSFP